MGAGPLYLWGCVGGAVAAVFVYVLPELIRGYRTGSLNFTTGKVLTVVAIVLIYTVIAGVVPLIPQDVDSRGEAISYGLATQTILKGLLSGAQDALRPT